jgi:uncharacterized protein YbbK (DUF523 family)
MRLYLISACLMGLITRYDGKVLPGPPGRIVCTEAICIPVCPEQLGGLPTPRSPADLVGGDGHDVMAGRARVIARDGQDVTENFILGARQVLTIARQNSVDRVILKARSPSCGLTPVIGVAAAFLKEQGYDVVEME